MAVCCGDRFEFTIYLYEKINRNNRLIVIKGAKGVGKNDHASSAYLALF